MRRLHRRTHRGEDAAGAGGFEPAFGNQLPLQIHAAHQLHHQVRPAVGQRAAGEHPHDRRMRQPRQCLRFAKEALAGRRIRHELRPDHLDRDGPVQHDVARGVHRLPSRRGPAVPRSGICPPALPASRARGTAGPCDADCSCTDEAPGPWSYRTRDSGLGLGARGSGLGLVQRHARGDRIREPGRFNVAAPGSARRLAVRAYAWQARGWRFNVAAPGSARRRRRLDAGVQFASGASMWPRLDRRGDVRQPHPIVGVGVASMWPRLDRRGDRSRTGARTSRRTCFNVAAPGSARRPTSIHTTNSPGRSSLQCGRAWIGAETCASSGSRMSALGWQMLQCGRAWIGAETRPGRPSPPRIIFASMWPRLDRRGDRRRRQPAGAAVPASMWPRLDRRGDRIRTLDAERLLSPRASMWPRLDRRGDACKPLSKRLASLSLASMWPRLDRRGDRSLAKPFHY